MIHHDQSVWPSYGTNGQCFCGIGAGDDPGTDSKRDEREAEARRANQRPRAVRLGRCKSNEIEWLLDGKVGITKGGENGYVGISYCRCKAPVG